MSARKLNCECALMPKFRQVNDILKLMKKKEDIRNIGIIAHIDHGKTTMTDSLLAEAGLLAPQVAGQARALDYLEEEQKRGITIKTANISLLHETASKPYLINLIDTPGHVDFTGKVTRALRAIDGAIVVVDAVEEVMAQTETVTRQALDERIKPVLFINKVDRLIKELRLTADEIQAKLLRVISDFNNLLELYVEPMFKNQWKVDLAKGTVAFGSALHKWGLTLDIAKQKRIKFSDIVNAYQKRDYQQLRKMVPLHNAILDMAVKHLPNPVQAQKYRVPKIWKGDNESEIGQALLNCCDTGPTVMCVTMVQMDPKAGLIATGRLFSGEVKEGDRVYLVGVQRDYRIQQVSIYMGAFKEVVDRIAAGNIAALSSLNSARTGETLVDFANREVMVPFERIKYVSEPIVTIALELKNPRELPRLVDAMQRLVLEDPNLATTINKETGEYLLSGMGELHLEIAVKFLKDHVGGNLGLIASKPIVVVRESVTHRGVVALGKSPDGHNRLWIQVEPLEDKVIAMIEKDEITMEINQKQIAVMLQKEAGWSAEEARGVWAIDERKNMLVAMTRSVEHLRETMGAVISGFKWGCEQGPLCDEPVRGIKVKLIDAQLHADSAFRSAAQIMPATRKAMFASFLSAKPTLLEPIYRISVSVPAKWLGEASSIITRKRGRITSLEKKGSVTSILGFIPVSETFGLAAQMRSGTSGYGFWQSTFDHWERIPADAALTMIQELRKKRGLPPKIPSVDEFLD